MSFVGRSERQEARQNEGKKVSCLKLNKRAPPSSPEQKTINTPIKCTILQNKRPVRFSILIQTKLKQKNKILKCASMLASEFFPFCVCMLACVKSNFVYVCMYGHHI